MLINLQQNGIRDFVQRYCDTYGWLIQENKRKFVYIESIADGKIHFNVDDGVEYFVYTDSNTTFEFIPVDRGWFNTNNGNSLFLCRKPTRQWKRGISSSNTDIISIDHIPKEVNYSTLSSIFNEDFTKNNYPKEFKPGALSKHFCLTKNNTILVYLQPIGTVVNNIIKVNNKLFTQEIIDLVSRNEWDVKIEHNF